MNKYFVLLLSFVFIFQFSYSQIPGQWMWIHGSNFTGSAGSHGTQGVPSALNEPPSLYEPCNWTDLNGNFWMYGGEPSGEDLNDLWKYDPVANEWTWMTGTAAYDDAGVYGVMGVPSASNRPPSKGGAVSTWVDLNGNLWMFGGRGLNSSYSDLWMYNISTNEWTWMKDPADGPGIYGSLGIPNAANYPPTRQETAATWTDNAGDLWLFGGYTGNFYNDLWRFNIASNSWTWMNGPNTPDQPAVYGTKGVENSSNVPGSRCVYSKWKDDNGALWIFGGIDFNFDDLNDLWRYNPVTNSWTWMSGSNVSDANGAFGTRCVTNAGNVPGARAENRASWTDAKGNFWMFGGIYEIGELNDLWMYCPVSNQWTWIAGDTTFDSPGSWGTLGVSSATNRPSGRDGSDAWTDNKNHLYLFGGYGSYNDLWVFAIDSSCGAACGSAVVPPVTSFQASDSLICAYDCISFINLCSNATSWSWSFAGAMPTGSTDETPQNICYQSAGNFNVTLVAINSGGRDSVTFSSYINVKSVPPTPVITPLGNILYCSTDSSYASYQWYDSTALIPGATDTFLVITHDGNYNVQVANSNGCKIAVGIDIILGMESHSLNNVIALSPDPVANELRIKNTDIKTGRVDIYDMMGKQVYESSISGLSSEIDVSLLSSGIYFIRITGHDRVFTGKFVKEQM